MNNTAQLTQQFSERLNAFLLQARNRAAAQFEHDIKVNIPKGIVAPEDVLDHSMRIGVAGAWNQVHGWACEDAIGLAGDVLEDANCHTEHRAMLAVVRE